MEHRLMITLPDEVFQSLAEAAIRLGQTPEEIAVEWIAESAPARAVNGEHKKNGDITSSFGKRRERLSEQERAQAKARLKRFAGAVNSGDSRSADNERIDADLAREYGDTHEAEN